MRSTFQGLEIGKRAIIAQQTALSTTGHNIANANTEGYTRQEAVQKATRPLSYPSVTNGNMPMQIGTGVEVAEFKRMRDDYLDTQYRAQQQQTGYWQAKQTALSNIEAVFNEPSDSGLQATLDLFWQGMEDLASQPDSLAARAVVRARGEAVAASFRQLSSAIDQNEQDLKLKLSGAEQEINMIAKQISAFNNQIAQIAPHGYQPNDLYDQRDLMLDKLSKLVNVQIAPASNGMINVSIGGAQLVNGIQANKLELNIDSGTATIAGKTVGLDGGAVKGLFDAHGYTQAGKRTGTIPTLRENIDQLAQAFIDGINGLHSGENARNLDDIEARKANPTAPLDKLLFFVDGDDVTQPPKNAASMVVNPKIVDSLDKIAAAASDHIGDSTNARALANVRNTTMTIGEHTTTIGNFYQMILGQAGIDSQQAKQWSDNAELSLQQIDNQRQSASGVSIDEEMANMVRYQQAYNAAARYVSAVNDMLDKLINGI